MNRAEQIRTATQAKAQSVRAFQSLLNPYVRELVTSYQIGQNTINSDAKAELTRALRLGYIKAINSIVKTDIRQYKASDDLTNEVYTAVGAALNEVVVVRATSQTDKISRTSEKWVTRTSQLAIDNGWSQAEAKAALTNYLRSQKLVISTTESQAIIEGARRAVVVAVTDPLLNTIEEIVRLVSIGDVNAARRLSNQVLKLAKLPTSVSQGDLIRIIDTGRVGLMKPETQGRIIANLRARADELGTKIKEWQKLGFNTRDSHEQANGQQQPIDSPFILPGGLLQYPGDGSLGADLAEIINCNCVSVYL